MCSDITCCLCGTFYNMQICRMQKIPISLPLKIPPRLVPLSLCGSVFLDVEGGGGDGGKETTTPRKQIILRTETWNLIMQYAY